jgi:transposase-like protein
VTLRGEPYLLWRAVDQHGAELDILLQKRRDKAAARRFFKRVLASCTEAPRKIVTDQLRSYPAAKAEISELAHVRHVFVKASTRVNNGAENSHQRLGKTSAPRIGSVSLALMKYVQPKPATTVDRKPPRVSGRGFFVGY